MQNKMSVSPELIEKLKETMNELLDTVVLTSGAPMELRVYAISEIIFLKDTLDEYWELDEEDQEDCITQVCGSAGEIIKWLKQQSI